MCAVSCGDKKKAFRANLFISTPPPLMAAGSCTLKRGEKKKQVIEELVLATKKSEKKIMPSDSCELCKNSLCDRAGPEDAWCCHCIRHNLTLEIKRLRALLKEANDDKERGCEKPREPIERNAP